MTAGFTGKVALVTGAGRGIGRNIATLLSERGASVALCDIDAVHGAEAVTALAAKGGSAEFFAVDLARVADIKSLVDAVIGRFGRLDVVVNNARGGGRVTLAEDTEANWDLTMAVNLRAPYFLAQAALPRMAARSSIVNICSVSSLLVSLEAAGYQASKAGLLHLTRCLAVAGGARGIRVNAILPGFIVQDEHRPRYDAADNAQYRAAAEQVHPLAGGPGHSDEIAKAVAFLASDEASFITGQALTVDGGLTVQDQAALLFAQRMQS